MAWLDYGVDIALGLIRGIPGFIIGILGFIIGILGLVKRWGG